MNKSTDKSKWLYFNKCKFMPNGGVTAFIGNEYKYTEFTDACILPKKTKKTDEYFCVIDADHCIAAIGSQDQMKYLAHESRKNKFNLAETLQTDEYKKIA